MATISVHTNIMVTGATGYIGGRLVTPLVKAGYSVRLLSRDPERLSGRPWLDAVEVVEGDVLDRQTLDAAMKGVQVAYYLVHSLASGSAFREKDVEAAHNFGEA